jgi:hypothetical protein
MFLKWSSVLVFGLATIGLDFVLHSQSVFRNLSPIFMLGFCQLLVWHSSPLLLMAVNLTSFGPLLIMTQIAYI